MATNAPFQPLNAGTVGKTVKVTGNSTPTSVSGSLDVTGNPANNIRILNSGTVLGFVRVSTSASTVAANTDIPLAAGQPIVIANPAPNGKCRVAVLSSTTTAIDCYFTPGEGGS